MTNLAILWFRQDLRLSDNPALVAAVAKGEILPIFILDDEIAGEKKLGAASRWWLHHSLNSLNQSLLGNLNFYCGDSFEIIKRLVEEKKASSVFWNRCYEPFRISQDSKIKALLKENGTEANSFNGSLLWEPWQVLKSDKTPYKVFTPFYRKGCLAAEPPRDSLSIPKKILAIKDKKHSLTLDDLGLLPKISWDSEMKRIWEIGEIAAQKKLEKFVVNGLANYKEGRNFPSKPFVSRLSPHLHFGEISTNQVWQYAITSSNLGNAGFESNKNLDHFLSELGWREFSYYLLFHFPDLPTKNFQSQFDKFAWKNDQSHLKAWQKGKTGYPIIDAAMRELWQTGYMHNRARMIVVSFLVKNLLIDWREGEKWFWDCLVDADLASNSASWQWVAGSGADAAPYFRIFNPILQAKKFDENGDYIRRFVPELARLPTEFLFEPWKAGPLILRAANVELGKNYPHPIIDLESSRNLALKQWQQLRIASA